MGLDPQLAELLPHKVRWRTPTSRDAYGEPVYGPWSKRTGCYWSREPQTVRDMRGNEVTAAQSLFFHGDAAGLTEDSEIELPDASLAPPVVLLRRLTDEYNVLWSTTVHLGARARER